MREYPAAPGAASANTTAFDAQLGFRFFGKAIRDFVQLHAKTQVRLVAAILANRVLIKHVRKRPLRFNACNGARAHHHRFDDVKNIFLARERHFDVELREFGLAVGAQIFVAKTFDDLEVAVEAADHQDLLEDLRRLRQRVELAVMHAAGNEIVARAFGRRTREHGRFDFEEAQLVHGLANFEHDFVAQREVAVRFGTAQVEIAVAQARFFGGVDFVFDGKRRRFGVVQNVEFGGDELDFAGGEIRDSLFAASMTLPSTATTNSLRACSALACAAGCDSLLKTTWTMPVRSRMSRKSKLPRSRRPETQPMTMASRPSSEARNAPQ